MLRSMKDWASHARSSVTKDGYQTAKRMTGGSIMFVCVCNVGCHNTHNDCQGSDQVLFVWPFLCACRLHSAQDDLHCVVDFFELFAAGVSSVQHLLVTLVGKEGISLSLSLSHPPSHLAPSLIWFVFQCMKYQRAKFRMGTSFSMSRRESHPVSRATKELNQIPVMITNCRGEIGIIMPSFFFSSFFFSSGFNR